MNLPIQTAPIDRANRAVNMQAKTAGGVSLSQPDLCAICEILPPIPRAICKAICGGGGLLGH